MRAIATTLIFGLGLLIGQRLTLNYYDPATLETNILNNIKIIYTSGCINGIMEVTGKTGNYLYCMDSAEKVVKDYKDIFTNKIWSKQ
jgi:hypothetical protein